MKKVMTLVLGLSLAVGAFSYAAFGQDDTTKQTGKGKGGKKGSGKKGKDTTKS